MNKVKEIKFKKMQRIGREIFKDIKAYKDYYIPYNNKYIVVLKEETNKLIPLIYSITNKTIYTTQHIKEELIQDLKAMSNIDIDRELFSLVKHYIDNNEMSLYER